MITNVPFFRPAVGEEEIKEVVSILKSGWLTTGSWTRRFEEDFIAYLGGEVEAVAVCSATAGLHLALEAIGIGPGDEVLVPTLTFTATAEVVRYVGAKVVLVDIEADSLHIDLVDAGRRLTPRTRAIMPVHFAGLPCRMAEIYAFAKRHALAVIEDAAHALTAKVDGQRIGAHQSDAVVFSFYANKPITTGEGGMLITRRHEVAERARQMRLHGIDRDSFCRFSSSRWHYDVIAPGYKYNLPDILSAIGVKQLAKADHLREARARIAGRYTEMLAKLPVTPPTDAFAPDTHAWHIYPIRISKDVPIPRNALIEKLSSRGVTCSVHYRPLHLMTYWREQCQARPEDYPVSTAYFEHALTLPLFAQQSDGQIEYVIEQLKGLILHDTKASL